jgi:photosystem II stability/assembly factor-like uncharacterized protein
VTLDPDGTAATEPGSGELVRGRYGMSARRRTHCLAVGQTPWGTGVAAVTRNGGSTWRLAAMLGNVSTLKAVSCPATSNCFAVGQSPSGSGTVLATADGGGTWSAMSLPRAGRRSLLNSISCPGISECLVAGQSASMTGLVLATFDAGSTWHVAHPRGQLFSLDSVRCPANSHCFGGGQTETGQGAVVVTVNGGRTWRSESLALPAGILAVNGIACTTSAECWVAGAGQRPIAATRDGGTTWRAQPVPRRAGVLSSISCPTGRRCFAAGQGGIVATTNGGRTWTSQPIPRQLGFLQDVSCPSSTECWAAGFRILTGVAVIVTTAPTIERVSPASGPPGTVVTLRGINLSGATSVSFGGTAAGVTSDSARKLVTAVPPGASSGRISITTPLGRVFSPGPFKVT